MIIFIDIIFVYHFIEEAVFGLDRKLRFIHFKMPYYLLKQDNLKIIRAVRVEGCNIASQIPYYFMGVEL